MPCAQFEDLLLDYGELPAIEREMVDAHLAGCADCREYLETAAQLDTRLAELYAGAQVSPAFHQAMLARAAAEVVPAKPSMLPEVLDFIGWAGIIAAVVCLAPLAPHFRLEFNTFAAIAAAIAILAVWVGVHSYADLKH